MITYLERIDPDKNMHRFYALQITRTLFGTWALIRLWGRIDQQGGRRLEHWFESKEEAEAVLMTIQKKKEQRGYRSLG